MVLRAYAMCGTEMAYAGTGRGTYGMVFEGIDSVTGEIFAVKQGTGFTTARVRCKYLLFCAACA
eukprot:2769570-Rhodomonas_salina.1